MGEAAAVRTTAAHLDPEAVSDPSASRRRHPQLRNRRERRLLPSHSESAPAGNPPPGVDKAGHQSTGAAIIQNISTPRHRDLIGRARLAVAILSRACIRPRQAAGMRRRPESWPRPPDGNRPGSVSCKAQPMPSAKSADRRPNLSPHASGNPTARKAKM
jgi:hypothetical protein